MTEDVLGELAAICHIRHAGIAKDWGVTVAGHGAAVTLNMVYTGSGTPETCRRVEEGT
jgi:hypothetical protein